MKQLILFLFMGFGLSAQDLDTTQVFNINNEYKYEKIGNFHYLSIIQTNPDSSQLVNRSRPYKTKKEVMDLAKIQMENTSEVVNRINEEIKQKELYYKQILDQQMKFKSQVENEIVKTKNELISLRTNKKLIQESKEGLKNVK
jgi:hypothetical protein